jgi:hypothetical protein
MREGDLNSRFSSARQRPVTIKTKKSREYPAPQPECNKNRIRHQKPQCKIVTHKAAHKTSRGEHGVQPRDVFLDGVRALGENRRKKTICPLCCIALPSDLLLYVIIQTVIH